MTFDLWTFFVENLFGSFWLAILGIAIIMFVILAIMGKLAKLTVIYIMSLFLMIMTVGYGYKWITVLIGFFILLFVYIEYKNATGG